MCAYVCACVAYLYLFVHVYVEARGPYWGIFLSSSPPHVLTQGLSLNMELASQLDWLASEL